jgi:hypothetical protein
LIVQGEPWHIRYTDEQLLDVDSGDDLVGVYRPDDQEIVIYRGRRAAEAIWKTLMHELLHAISDSYTIKSLQKERNHDDLDRLAGALVEWMLANRFLKAKAKRARHVIKTSPRSGSTNDVEAMDSAGTQHHKNSGGA